MSDQQTTPEDAARAAFEQSIRLVQAIQHRLGSGAAELIIVLQQHADIHTPKTTMAGKLNQPPPRACGQPGNAALILLRLILSHDENRAHFS